MTLPRPLQLALALIVGAAGVFGAVYVVAGGNWFEMSENDLSRVEGCYTVAGQKVFSIAGRMISTSNGTFGFVGAHEKHGDVLVMDRPVRLVRRPHLMLAGEGTASKVTISYRNPLRLTFWDERGNQVEAWQTQCD